VVVVLTFDTEGSRFDSCTVTNVLDTHGVPAMFYVVGDDARRMATDAAWQACLSGFDLGNHTDRHHGAGAFALPGLFDTWSDAEITSEINNCTTAN
jgi:peptidoglycan/xylan/chitin deacetylase (PgdA/CDA1 family)